jgi:thiol-disulfide isomerase/thioredoxin
MNRREVLAGTGSLAALGLGAYAVFGRQAGSAGTRIEPVTIDTLDVAASPGTDIRVPFEGAVTIVDLFATTCPSCPDHIDTLDLAKEQLGGEVKIVSVTNQIVDDRQPRSYFRDWWDQHGADWPVGFDDGGALTRSFDVPPPPFTGIVAPDRTVVWSKSGQPTVETLVEQARSAAEAGE